LRRIITTGASLLALVACTGSTVGPPTTTPSGSGSITAAAPAAPDGLRASQPRRWASDPASWVVTLDWNPTAGARSYVVDRNGRTLASSVIDRSFKDTKPEPDSTYHYQVLAVGSGGALSKPASVTIKTHAPPLAEARLFGSFVTKLHITSQSGLQSGASGSRRLFRFVPRCETGACAVTWSEEGLPGKGILRPRSSGYSGTVSAPFGIGSCSGGRVSETLIFQIHVTRAQVLRHDWRAAAFAGRLRESAATKGCVTGRINYSMTGVLRP
jgi:hypothetical protein